MSRLRTFLVALLIGVVVGAVLAQLAEAELAKRKRRPDGAAPV